MPPQKKRRLSLYTHPKKALPIDEITFSPSARQEYLTGFHKRKLARAKYARELAEKKEREERLRVRREGRETRRRDLEERVAGVNAAIRGTGVLGEGSGVDEVRGEGGDEDGSEIGSSSGGAGVEIEEADREGDEEVRIDHEEEYIDEDKFTTVLVEEVDVDRDGLHKSRSGLNADPGGDDKADSKTENGRPDNGKRHWTKDKPKNPGSKPKLKRKKFRYENKAERKMTREKERSKNHKQAKARREK